MVDPIAAPPVLVPFLFGDQEEFELLVTHRISLVKQLRGGGLLDGVGADDAAGLSLVHDLGFPSLRGAGKFRGLKIFIGGLAIEASHVGHLVDLTYHVL